MQPDLALHEEYFLLAHDNFTGRKYINADVLGAGVAGALLAQMLLCGCVEEVAGTVAVRDAVPGADSVMRATLATIRRHDRPVTWWIEHLRHGVYQATARQVTARGMVTPVSAGLFRPTTRYPATDAVSAARPRVRLRHATADPGAADPPTALLAALAVSTGLATVVADAANRHARAGLTALTGAVPAWLLPLTQCVDATVARLTMTTTRGR